MSSLNQAMADKYRNRFLREVEANVEQGQWTRMCMQCGVCAGSCPLGDAWEHSPQKLFMMIRAGQREQVLRSDAMWMCTSCYHCTVRCPAGLPVTHIMHGLATYAERLGLAPKNNPTRKFALKFWANLSKDGRINELRLGLDLYFMNGFREGVKTSIEMVAVGRGMTLAGRMAPMAIINGHGIEDKAGFHKMLAKAKAIEQAKAEKFDQES